jgi:hypothetical protein
LSDQQSRLSNQLAYEQRRDMDDEVAALQQVCSITLRYVDSIVLVADLFNITPLDDF